ncbi:MAG TPA: hypothetical protein VL360_04385 [Gammaproteobacteria bacterium]|nr:hypothetical protein [Gammaproteobacteria bacterium]
MFQRPRTKTDNTSAGYRKMEEEELRAGLTEYVAKNRKIPEFYKEIDDDKTGVHQKKLGQLRAAIMQGETENEIFSDENAVIYLLFLIQKEKIPFWVGMTAYNYLLGLAQFTNRQRLKDEDNDIKNIRKIELLNLSEEGVITEFGEAYLCQLVIDLGQYGYNIDINKLKEFVCSLPPLEQIAMRIPIPGDKQNHDIDVLLLIMRGHVFYCKDIIPDCTLIPSMTLINYIHSQMDDEYMEMKPIYGIIGEKKLHNLHTANQHPLAVYSNLVQSNLKLVHTWRAGPIPAVIHDIGHVFWANMLAGKERLYIHDKLIPALNEAIIICEGGKIATDTLKAIVYKLNDYNLSPINFYVNRDKRLNTYVYRIINETLISPFILMDHEEQLAAVTLIAIMLETLNKLNVDDPKLRTLTNDIISTLEGCIQYYNNHDKRIEDDKSTIKSTKHASRHLNVVVIDLDEKTKSDIEPKTSISAHQKLMDHIYLNIRDNKYDEVNLMVGGNHQDPDIDKITRNTSGFTQLLQIHDELTSRISSTGSKCKITYDCYLLADTYSRCTPGESFTNAIKCQDAIGKYDTEKRKSSSLSSYKSVSDASRLQTVYAQIHKQAIAAPHSKIVYDYYISDQSTAKILGSFFTSNRDLIPKNVTLRIHVYEGDDKLTLENKNDVRKLILSTVECAGSGQTDHNYEENIKLMMQCCRNAYPSVAYSTVFNAARTFSYKPDSLKEFKKRRQLVPQKKAGTTLRTGI